MTALFKLLFDTLLYYTLSAFFLSVLFRETPSVPGLLLLTLLLLGDGLLREKGNFAKAPRLVLLALPLLLLPAKPGLPVLLQMLPVWLYLGVSVLSDRVAADYFDFRRRFGAGLFLAFMVLLFSLLSEDGRESFRTLLPYLTLLLCEGICTLRVLREKRESWRQVLIMLLFAAGGLLLTLGRAPELLLAVLGFLYRYVIANGLFLLGAALAFVLYGLVVGIIGLVSLFFDGPKPYLLEMKGTLARNIRGLEDGFTFRQHPALTVMGYGLLALLLLYLLLLFFRSMLGRKTGQSGVRRKTGTRERLRPGRESSGFGLLAPREPRLRIRYIYAKFLRECRKRGLYPAPGRTSEELVQDSRTAFPGKDVGALQKLYAKARYSEREIITREEAERAAELLRELKKEQGR